MVFSLILSELEERLACIIREKWNDEEFFGERNKVCGQSGID
jgi:hypothetical protein